MASPAHAAKNRRPTLRDEVRPAEILERLKRTIAGFAPDQTEVEVGQVVQSGDGIARVWGLREVRTGEIVEVEVDDETPVHGLVMNLEQDTVGVVLFAGAERVKEGALVRRTKRMLEVPVGETLVGRVVDPLGNPLDGKGPLFPTSFRAVEAKAPGIVDRENVGQPLQTGIKAIDAMIPIGCGQRELIIGDRRTGKTTLAVDTILNQSRVFGGPDQVQCFYVAIGQKLSSVVRLVEILDARGAMAYTTVVAATASDPASLLYLAPYSATAMAEFYRDSGCHALVVFDDLTKHAQAYRELSLLMRRSPGREAFPGDIFYVHSRLLERAAKLNAAHGGGSLTALPIVETQEGDVAAYIPTNVISITDGQIFLVANLFNAGLRPALNVGISVSRVGGEAQVKAMKQVASSLRIDLAQFRELAAFLQFSSELDSTTRRHLDRGERLTEILKQGQYSPLDAYQQVMILRAGVSGRLDRYPVDKLSLYQERLFAYLDGPGAPFMARLREAGQFDAQLDREAENVFVAFEATLGPEAVSHGVDAGYAMNLAMALGQNTARPEALQLAQKLTTRELARPSLAKELEDIVNGRDLLDQDRLQKLFQACPILDVEVADRLEVFHEASRYLAERLGVSDQVIFDDLMAREAARSSAVPPGFAIPSTIAGRKGAFELVILRSRQGLEFPSVPSVHLLFFLAGASDQWHFTLVVISALAALFTDQTFQKSGPEASIEDLRRLILNRGTK